MVDLKQGSETEEPLGMTLLEIGAWVWVNTENRKVANRIVALADELERDEKHIRRLRTQIVDLQTELAQLHKGHK